MADEQTPLVRDPQLLWVLQDIHSQLKKQSEQNVAIRWDVYNHSVAVNQHLDAQDQKIAEVEKMAKVKVNFAAVVKVLGLLATGFGASHLPGWFLKIGEMVASLNP